MDLDLPALAPPEGITPNFDNPSNRNGLGRFVISISATLTTLCFLLRMYGRIILVRKFQAEEALATLGYGCFWGCIWAMIKFQNTPGYYVHQWDIHLRELIATQYLILIFGVCFAVVLPSLKAAILTEWCRIFIPGEKRKTPFWWICVVVIFFQVVASAAIIVALNTQCTPYTSIWYITMDRKCWDIYSLQVTVAAIHLAGDVAIFLLPQQKLWRLKMSLPRKLGISIVFGLGLVACVAAGARLTTMVINKKTKDNTYKLATPLIWAAAEMSCGFIVFCIPCLPSILKENAIARGIQTKYSIKPAKVGSNSTGLETFGGTGGASKHGRTPTLGSRSYAKLDEEAYPLERLADSESRGNLRLKRNSSTSPNKLAVVCTTKITVVEEDGTEEECGNSSKAYTKSIT